MDRRTFMSWVGLGAIVSSLPVAIAACSSDTPTADAPTNAPADAPPPPPPPGSIQERPDGFVEVGTVSDLDANGSITNKNFSAGPLAVFRDPTQADTIVALDAKCPHQGCVCAWNKNDGVLLCPCHGSKFKPDGSIVTGPADKPLKLFEAKIEGDVVLVKA
ncbi:MAG: Rieske (2Fe-2S) protein [Thermosynechococcaceae cyanobacterium]